MEVQEKCKMIRDSHCLLLIIWPSHIAITYFIVMFLSSVNKSVFMTFPLITFLLKMRSMLIDNEWYELSSW